MNQLQDDDDGKLPEYGSDQNPLPAAVYEQAAAAFDYAADSWVVVRSKVLTATWHLSFASALQSCAFLTANRISFTLGVELPSGQLVPLFAFDARGAFTGDERALRLMEQMNIGFEGQMRAFFKD